MHIPSRKRYTCLYSRQTATTLTVQLLVLVVVSGVAAIHETDPIHPTVRVRNPVEDAFLVVSSLRFLDKLGFPPRLGCLCLHELVRLTRAHDLIRLEEVLDARVLIEVPAAEHRGGRQSR